MYSLLSSCLDLHPNIVPVSASCIYCYSPLVFCLNPSGAAHILHFFEVALGKTSMPSVLWYFLEVALGKTCMPSVLWYQPRMHVNGYLNPSMRYDGCIWLVNKVHMSAHNDPVLDDPSKQKVTKVATSFELFPKVLLAPTIKESLCFNN